MRNIERKREYDREYWKQYREKNREKLRATARKYAAEHKEKRRSNRELRKLEYPERIREEQKRYREKNHKECVEYNKRYRDGMKEKVFGHYGRWCSCCGESRIEFLSIDHIDGGGSRHRREIGSGSLYRWLVKNNFPPGFRTLCMNCNFSRGHFGYCPHERENGTTISIAQ